MRCEDLFNANIYRRDAIFLANMSQTFLNFLTEALLCLAEAENIRIDLVPEFVAIVEKKWNPHSHVILVSGYKMGISFVCRNMWSARKHLRFFGLDSTTNPIEVQTALNEHNATLNNANMEIKWGKWHPTDSIFTGIIYVLFRRIRLGCMSCLLCLCFCTICFSSCSSFVYFFVAAIELNSPSFYFFVCTLVVITFIWIYNIWITLPTSRLQHKNGAIDSWSAI